MANPAVPQHGPMFTGFMLNCVLLGVTIAQLYIYYTTYQRDRVWIKLSVAFIFLVDVANTAFIFAYIYRVLIVGFGDFEQLFIADWVFASGAATTAIIALLVQHFFTWRVRMLTRTWSISCVIVILISATSLLSAATGLVSAWEVSRHPRFEQFQEAHRIVSTWLAASAVCDILITVSLVIALRSQKSGIRQSDLMVDRIIKLSLQTGLITVIVAVVDMILFVTLASRSGAHQTLNYCLSKLYTNSLLSSLNSRRALAHDGSIMEDLDVESEHTRPYRSAFGKQSLRFASSFRDDTDVLNIPRPPRPQVFVHIQEVQELADLEVENKVKVGPSMD